MLMWYIVMSLVSVNLEADTFPEPVDKSLVQLTP